ncbi:hypothetical protein ACFWWC_26635 [Streptomyces sp. NPDC058642]
MSLFIAASVQVPFARYWTPWMPPGRWETAMAGQSRWAPLRKLIRMSPL